MKLYTEEQIKEAMADARISPSLKIDFLLGDYNPIELPSNEEIEKFSKIFNHLNNRDMFITGAHWALNHIKQQDNV